MAKKTTTTTVTTTTVTETTPDNNKTHIICILDRSGSMNSVASDAIGGFNKFLKDQKETPGEVTMNVTLFDHEYTPLYDGKSVALKEVVELTDKTFVPRGTTALYDAIGKTVGRTKEEFAKMKNEEVPSKVLVVIVTDGAENASHEYSSKAIVDLIADQKKADWQFIFMCSTEDALKRAESMGVSRGNSMKFAATGAGNLEAFATLSNASKFYRSSSKISASFAADSSNLVSYAAAGLDSVDQVSASSRLADSNVNIAGAGTSNTTTSTDGSTTDTTDKK